MSSIKDQWNLLLVYVNHFVILETIQKTLELSNQNLYLMTKLLSQPIFYQKISTTHTSICILKLTAKTMMKNLDLIMFS